MVFAEARLATSESARPGGAEARNVLWEAGRPTRKHCWKQGRCRDSDVGPAAGERRGGRFRLGTAD
jgi:hypothetical protein